MNLDENIVRKEFRSMIKEKYEWYDSGNDESDDSESGDEESDNDEEFDSDVDEENDEEFDSMVDMLDSDYDEFEEKGFESASSSMEGEESNNFFDSQVEPEFEFEDFELEEDPIEKEFTK